MNRSFLNPGSLTIAITVLIRLIKISCRKITLIYRKSIKSEMENNLICYNERFQIIQKIVFPLENMAINFVEN